MQVSSKPLRNFTVTGFFHRFHEFRKDFLHQLRVSMRAEPSPFLTIFGTGQPMLISKISYGPSSRLAAAISATISGSEPKAAGTRDAPAHPPLRAPEYFYSCRGSPFAHHLHAHQTCSLLPAENPVRHIRHARHRGEDHIVFKFHISDFLTSLNQNSLCVYVPSVRRISVG